MRLLIFVGSLTGTTSSPWRNSPADRASLLALAQGGRDYKFCRPLITASNIIDIEGGRYAFPLQFHRQPADNEHSHPLQELTVPSYVANDTKLVGGSGPGSPSEGQTVGESHQERSSTLEDAEAPSMLLMTGPNYSGKSVYLKQIAVIVYIAHAGCFVPADRATIGLTDKIMTRIATRETVSKAQSAFMIDLQQVALATKLATHRSLVIIDEFGKGTDSNGEIQCWFSSTYADSYHRRSWPGLRRI